MPRILLLAAAVVMLIGVRAHGAEPMRRIPCWQAKAWLAYHGGDRNAARQAALARGYTRDEVRDAERRCS